MSTLSNKILSYSPEVYYRFNQAYTTIPTNSGSTGSTTFGLTNEAPTLNATGGIHGEGSWIFNAGNGTSDLTTTRFLASGANNLNNAYADVDYSVGFWFKTNYTLQNSLAHASTYQIMTIGGAPQRFFSLNIVGGIASGPDKGKLRLTATGSSGATTTARIDDQQWHYISLTVQPYVSGSQEIKLYIDGSFIGNAIPTVTSQSLTTNFGPVANFTASAGSGDLTTHEYSDFYVTPLSVIGATQIAEIWTAGTSTGSTNITITETPATATALMVDPTLSISDNILETPATASALMTEPTVVIVANNNTQVTTSFLASVTIPQNIVAGGDRNVNNVITEVLTASAELINNVEIDTGTNSSYSATEMTATATLTEARVSEVPMTASATMPGGTASVTPNYYSLVKAGNPLFYTNLDDSTITNFGSWPNVTYSIGSTVTKNLASTNKMGLIGAGESWRFTGTSSANTNFVRIIPENVNTTIRDLVLNKSYTIEAWTKISNNLNGVYSGFKIEFANIEFKIDRTTDITYTASDNPGIILQATNLVNGFDGTYSYSGAPQSSTNYYLSEPDASLIKVNDWNHVVITVSGDTVAVYINGSFWSGFTKAIDATVVNGGAYLNWDEINIYDGFDTNDGGAYIDEIAVYGYPLTQSTIIDHHSFINNQSPDSTIYSTPLVAIVSEQTHQFYATANTNISSTTLTSSAEFVEPSILSQRTINFAASPLTASANNTDVTVFYGWTINATPATAYAERPEAYFLNDIYYQYVQTNIAPYRYVTFDSANASLDYGTDNDYSVAPTTIGGTVVNPDLGINGKSVKTTGSSFITDGVILNESEWNDSWGTGANSYHSAFWFQRALDDASTTGLRVLWNLNGYKDNQHVVLYQYQGKVHMQFNNGSGTWVEQDTGTLDLFDYQRHFVVVEFNHTNPNNNVVKLYVDAVLKSTINLGAYTGTTTNASSADSGPNNEANNRPRLSIGCLITPFGSTALPVQPTTTKLIIDEVYWDNNSISSTVVTNLFNAMPDKTNKQIVVEPFVASDELVMPAISTSSAVSAAPSTASGSLVQPAITANREVVTTANAMTATALAVNARVFEDRTILSDIMLATVTFNNAGTVITIPGPTMYASVMLRSSALRVNGLYPNTMMTPWVTYLRATEANSILATREVV
jgi:hypothetical protein